ncbi:MAG TPA: hypothetical protein VMU00_12105 [Steroidobacteraceae bacterium]|nr:hypothetical protein [Steroidobacteraceae bacterium]
MKPTRRPRREALAWLRAESALQRRRARALAAATEALAPRRERWIEAFLAGLESPGVEQEDGTRRRLPAEELPSRPRRRPRVVY